jgi:hypothetical protein
VFGISIQTQAKNFPDASARCSRDLPTNDKNGLPSRKRFSWRGALKKADQAPDRPRSLGDAHYSTHYFDYRVAWSSAGLAIQHWLGLLPKRRDRINLVDCDNPRRDGAIVRRGTRA